jgi:hypothetical protein
LLPRMARGGAADDLAREEVEQDERWRSALLGAAEPPVR